MSVPLLLIPLDYAVPALQASLNATGIDPGKVRAAADLLERCVRTGEALVALALLVGGKPSRQ